MPYSASEPVSEEIESQEPLRGKQLESLWSVAREKTDLINNPKA